MRRLLTLTCILLFTSCLSTNYFLKHNQIPNDFGRDNKPVFIIISSSYRIDKIILDAFEKYYKGPYVFVRHDEVLRNFGYSFTAYKRYNTTFDLSGGFDRSRELQFQLQDLKTGKIFESDGYGFTKTKAKYYIQALEIVRQQNQ